MAWPKIIPAVDAELTSSHLRATSRPSKTHVWYRGYSTGTEFDMPEICSIGAVCQPCAIRSLPSSVLWPGFYNGKPCNETQQAIPDFIRNGWYTIEFHRISIFLQVYMAFPQQIMLFCIKKKGPIRTAWEWRIKMPKSPRRFPKFGFHRWSDGTAHEALSESLGKWTTRRHVLPMARWNIRWNIRLYMHTWEGGGRKPAPKAMLMVFFVSALKYLEVKAVASC